MRTSNYRGSWRGQQDRYDQRRNSEPDFYQDRNENYENNGYYEASSRPDRGYGNPDYDERNYRFGQREEMEWGNGSQQYVPEMDYGPRRRNPRTQVTGYGNQNSRFMNEFERWRNGSDDYRSDYYNSRNNNSGNRSDYYRADAGMNQYDRHNGYDNERYQQNYDRNDAPDYNYYESYPSYGQGAPYNDHERGYIRKQEAMGNRGFDNDDDYSYRRDDSQGNRRRFSSNEFDRRRRPMIRDKRY